MHALSAVKQGQALFRRELDRLKPHAPQRFAAGQPLALKKCFAFADDAQR